ncbi:MAG: acetyl-CoA carboxylase biotin carboxyl carrier protein [Myxococcales bacterium]
MDVEKLKKILDLLSGSDITSLDWKSGDESVTIRRGARSPAPEAAPSGTHPRPAPPSATLAEPQAAPAHLHTVTSPFVGTFYRAASPEAPAFVEVGQPVRKGQVLCIVEAMKLMNEIEAEIAGRVVEVLVQNGQAVEFGEPLFRLEPAAG